MTALFGSKQPSLCRIPEQSVRQNKGQYKAKQEELGGGASVSVSIVDKHQSKTSNDVLGDCNTTDIPEDNNNNDDDSNEASAASSASFSSFDDASGSAMDRHHSSCSSDNNDYNDHPHANTTNNSSNGTVSKTPCAATATTATATTHNNQPWLLTLKSPQVYHPTCFITTCSYPSQRLPSSFTHTNTAVFQLIPEKEGVV